MLGVITTRSSRTVFIFRLLSDRIMVFRHLPPSCRGGRIPVHHDPPTHEIILNPGNRSYGGMVNWEHPISQVLGQPVVVNRTGPGAP
jgi:hypothetical protein